MGKDGPLVGIIMGSSSDSGVMRTAADALDSLGVAHEDQIVSAHRTPDRLAWYAGHAEESGIGAIIAGAGGAAHLPGMVASFTTIPVIGVPIISYNGRGAAGAPASSSFGGLDSLLSMTEMPSGSPVAVVGINKAANAGILAARILAGTVPGLRQRLEDAKRKRHDGVVAESERMKGSGLSGFPSGK